MSGNPDLHKQANRQGRKTSIPWGKIKGEYLTRYGSLQELSKKYGVKWSTMRERARLEGWKSQQKEIQEEAKQKVVEAMSQNLIEHMKDISVLTGEMLAKLKTISKTVVLSQIKTIDDFSKFTIALQRLDDIRRKALGANDGASKSDQEGMTPSNLARQEVMLQNLSDIRALVEQGKVIEIAPDLEAMKRAIIVEDGS